MKKELQEDIKILKFQLFQAQKLKHNQIPSSRQQLYHKKSSNLFTIKKIHLSYPSWKYYQQSITS